MERLKKTSLWTEMSDFEKINTRDGVEKYLLNRIYRITFNADDSIDLELREKLSVFASHVNADTLKINTDLWEVRSKQYGLIQQVVVSTASEVQCEGFKQSYYFNLV